ncbi:MAG TPA: hypothetical protein VFN42_03840 [Acetobacteraceae bacterium]|nr:hypothetical protein [Acetobacteraceae bacterium]
MMLPRHRAGLVLLIVLVVSAAAATQPDSGLVTRGAVEIGGKQVPYVVRHLPVASFPELPAAVADELTRRGCLVPQTYEAHQPENVVHGSFQQPGSSDWAVLCSVDGEVKLLVFLGSDAAAPMTIGSAAETQRVQPYPGGSAMGFNWGIDRAGAEAVREAQTGLRPRPARIDHDALADSVVEQRTIYHYYKSGHWVLLDMPD